MQKVFPNEWHLKAVLPLDCEYNTNGISYFVPSSFFVWTKNEIKNDLRRKEPKENNDFLFLSRGDKNADFTINGNNGKIKELSQITNSKAEHYIKSLIDVDELKNRFRNIKFIFYIE